MRFPLHVLFFPLCCIVHIHLQSKWIVFVEYYPSQGVSKDVQHPLHWWLEVGISSGLQLHVDTK